MRHPKPYLSPPATHEHRKPHSQRAKIAGNARADATAHNLDTRLPICTRPHALHTALDDAEVRRRQGPGRRVRIGRADRTAHECGGARKRRGVLRLEDTRGGEHAGAWRGVRERREWEAQWRRGEAGGQVSLGCVRRCEEALERNPGEMSARRDGRVDGGGRTAGTAA